MLDMTNRREFLKAIGLGGIAITVTGGRVLVEPTVDESTVHEVAMWAGPFDLSNSVVHTPGCFDILNKDGYELLTREFMAERIENTETGEVRFWVPPLEEQLAEETLGNGERVRLRIPEYGIDTVYEIGHDPAITEATVESQFGDHLPEKGLFGPEDVIYA